MLNETDEIGPLCLYHSLCVCVCVTLPVCAANIWIYNPYLVIKKHLDLLNPVDQLRKIILVWIMSGGSDGAWIMRSFIHDSFTTG